MPKKPAVKRRPRYVKATVKVEKPRVNLSMFEQETTINYNREEKDATLFTYQKSLIKHMKKMGAKVEYVNTHGGTSFSFPKNWVRKPLVPRNERDTIE